MVQPVLEIGSAEADLARDEEAEACRRHEEHEVANERAQHESAQRNRCRRLWTWSDRLQAQKIGDHGRPSERTGGGQDGERLPWVRTRCRAHGPDIVRPHSLGRHDLTRELSRLTGWSGIAPAGSDILTRG